MGKHHFTKKGVLIYRTSRGHQKYVPTEHGVPFPPGARRPGTKYKAGAGGGKSRGFHGGDGGLFKRTRISTINAAEQGVAIKREKIPPC